MGAEKTAPPGMGNRPIKAGKIIRFSRGLEISPRKLLRSRCICPPFSMLSLSTRIRETIIANTRVLGNNTDAIIDLIVPVMLKPKKRLNAKLPKRNALPRENFFLIMYKIRKKIRATLTSAGI